MILSQIVYNLVMKIYTKTGDGGETSLCNAQRVKKSDSRVCAYGTVDELNCVLGEAAAICENPEIKSLIEDVQRDLFVIGSYLAEANISDWFDVKKLEDKIDAMQSVLPELKDFILPGGCILAAKIHTARAVCRRAERGVCKIANKKTITSQIAQYLNRLSDLLFVLARYTNMKCGNADIKWH